MQRIRVHYDGKALIPEEPVDLPVDQVLEVDVNVTNVKPLRDLAKALAKTLPNTTWPPDGATQHNHYLYGTSKQE